MTDEIRENVIVQEPVVEPQAIEKDQGVANPEIPGDIESIRAENEQLKANNKRYREERSQMGRRLKDMEERYRSIEQRISSIGSPGKEDVENLDIDVISDPKKLLDIIDKRAEKIVETKEKTRTESQKRYEDSYINQLFELGEAEDQEVYEQIVDLMKKDERFNAKHIGDPKGDAQINYYKARAEVVKNAKKQNPFKGSQSNIPTGVGGSAEIKTKEPPMPKLDEAAKEYLRLRGKDSNWAKKHLIET